MKLLFLFTFILTSLSASSFVGDIRWHNENSDTTLITNILSEASQKQFANSSERTGYIARKFIGTPYVAHTLEGDKEVLTVNLDELDCTTFVDIALALSYTLGENRLGWQDFAYNLRRMRYRDGEVDGYASRLHYNCDWAINNIHRGNINDITPLLPRYNYMIRTIDFMSHNRSSYQALEDSENFAKIQQIENGYRNHRFPYIKTADLANESIDNMLRDGDIVAFVSKINNLDVTHMGIVVKIDGETRVLHASMTNGKVEISDTTLAAFVKRNRNWIGIRIYRLKE